jgi:hypothetical protein
VTASKNGLAVTTVKVGLIARQVNLVDAAAQKVIVREGIRLVGRRWLSANLRLLRQRCARKTRRLGSIGKNEYLLTRVRKGESYGW